MSINVAYLGPRGTFTEAALMEFERSGFFSGAVNAVPVSSAAEAVHCVSTHAALYAVVAIENSVDGPVTTTFDALASDDDLQIYAECDLEVAFSIMQRPRTRNPRTLATHPVAWQQIKGWVGAHLPDVRFVPASSNADAARMVADGEADIAAAPPLAATLYGLEVVAENVADSAGAHTRFVLVGTRGKPPARTGNDRTSVAFTLPNIPGSLVRALNEFAVRGVDLSRIESRPTRKRFGTYRFYVDLTGHIDDIPLAEALRALYLHTEHLHFLGSWPAAAGEKGDTYLSEALARIHDADVFVRSLQTGTDEE